MTPEQREAALRLANALLGLQGRKSSKSACEAAALLRELAAEPVQEPVAVTTKGHLAAMQNGYTRSVVARDPKFAAIGAMQDNDVPLYAHPPQQRKPYTSVDEMFAAAEIADLKAANQILHSIIDSQQQRKPLTDEQIKAMFEKSCEHPLSNFVNRFARAVEKAHGITGETP